MKGYTIACAQENSKIEYCSYTQICVIQPEQERVCCEQPLSTIISIDEILKTGISSFEPSLDLLLSRHRTMIGIHPGY